MIKLFKSVRGKLLGVLVFLGIVLIGLSTLSIYMSNLIKTDAKIINTAGLQRALTQIMAKDAAFIALGFNEKIFIERIF
ncbi:hypothetical protein [Methanocaldococcus sp.]